MSNLALVRNTLTAPIVFNRPRVVKFAKQATPAAVLLGLVLADMAGAQATGAAGDISQAQFTDLATKILTYLGYAIVAGLTVLVAVLGAMAGWRFFGKFIKA